MNRVRGKINKLIALPILAVLIIASMPAIIPVRGAVPPPVYLYVDGFTAERTAWTAVGTSPYLNAPGDGSYIEGTVDTAQERWFTFQDIDPSYFTDYAIDKVWLEGYTNGPYDTGVDFDVYNAGFDWLGSLYADGAPKWVTLRWVSGPVSDADPSLKTEAGIDAFKVLVYFYDPDLHGGPGNIIDSIRLMVEFKALYPPIPVLAVSPKVNTGGVSETFTIEIVIKAPPYVPVIDLYGIDFKLAFDPAVVMATSIVPGDFWVGGVFEWINYIDPSGYAWYTVTRPLGTIPGLSGSGTIAVIEFSVVGVGVSGLDLYDVDAANRYAVPIALLPQSGVFANAADITVNLRTAYVGKRHITPPEAQTLTAHVKNKGAARTTAKAHFVIWTEEGIEAADLYSQPISIAAGATEYLSVSWSDYAKLTKYHVEVTVLYRDPAGGWSVGLKGTEQSHWDSMTINFLVYP